MSDGADGSAGPKTPADFLRTIKGKPVVVKLNSGVDYRGNVYLQPPDKCHLHCATSDPRSGRAGILACLDGYMNIAMEATEVREILMTTYGTERHD